jgi:hypothetical protein
MSECSNRRALRRDKLDEGRNLAVRDGCAHVVYLQGRQKSNAPALLMCFDFAADLSLVQML